MLKDRHYNIPLKIQSLTHNEFKNISNPTSKHCKTSILNFSIQDKHLPTIHTQFILLSKIKSSIIVDIIKRVKLKDNDRIIFVLKVKPSTQLLKIAKTYPIHNIQYYMINQLLFNITKHTLVPNHSLETDIDTIKKQYSITSIKQLPVILKTDPISKYYAFCPGDIIKIERPSITSGAYISYRHVR